MTDHEDTDLPPGLRRYILGLLRRVPGRPEISEIEANRIQEAHVANLRRLTESGDIVACGPFEEESELRGVIVFSADTLDAAREVIKDDPTLVNGRLSIELFTWWAPIGLEVNPDAAEADEAVRRLASDG